jgi:hypothetical protein
MRLSSGARGVTVDPPVQAQVRPGGSGAVLEAPAVVAGLNDVAVVSKAIEQRCGHFGIAEHLRIPQRLTGESLRCGWLIRTIPYMASAFRSATDARDGDLG